MHCSDRGNDARRSWVLANPPGARYQDARAFAGHWPDRVAGSAAIAQLVEHVIRNDGVTGSNPVCGTNQINHLASFREFAKTVCVYTVSANQLPHCWT